MFRLLAGLIFFAASSGLGGIAQAANPPSQEGDFIVRNFAFQSGETLSTLRLHYTTLGKPLRDGAGHVTNAVMILHGTSSDGRQFFLPQFADVLFAPGGLLDPEKYFIVLPVSVMVSLPSRAMECAPTSRNTDITTWSKRNICC